MKNTVLILSFLALLVPATAFSEIPGEYEMIIPNVPPNEHSLDQVRIHEVFSFYCGHCYHFDKQEKPKLKKKFGDKVLFIPQPIGWEGHDPGRLYFIAEERGKGDKILMILFDYIHNKGLGKGMYQRGNLQFVAKRNGLWEEFNTLMDAPEIVNKMNASIQYAKDRSIDSTPTLVIENVLKPKRSFENLVTIINALLKEPVP